MLAALAAGGLSLAPIDVPFVPQTDALCGGAAAAMVLRYWGDRSADAQQFAPLVERRPGGIVGIATDVLDSAVRARGWRTEHLDTSSGAPPLRALQLRIEARQPVIVLLADRRDRFHYVVVNGWSDRTIVVHDPSWGPFRRLRSGEFLRLWAASGYWAVTILPSPERPAAAPPRPPPAANSTPHADPCDAALNSAVEAVRVRGLDAADSLIEPLLAKCPDAAGPLRELAGVRFIQRRWSEAEDYAARAVERDPNDEHALFLLGSTRFMEDDSIGALRAWNRIGRPKLDLVRIEGLRHSRYQTIADALALRPSTMLTASAFARAERRLEELPDRASARIGVRPQEDGTVSVDVAIAERALPRGALEWSATAVRAAVDREVAIDLPGFTGQGELWSASWRWWSNRPRVAASFAAPRVGRLPGVWRVDGSWEAESYAAGSAGRRREERTHAGLTISDWLSGRLRYSASGGFDAWDGERRAASLGGSLERRWIDNRLATGVDFTAWFPVRDVADRGRFSAAGGWTTFRSATDAREWAFEGTVGLARVGDAAPLTLWPGAGEGRARPLLLRAHPLLDDGIIDLGGTTFGRTLKYATGEGQRWFAKPSIVRLGAAAFVDVAGASRRAVSSSTLPTPQVDVGVGLRVRLPGVGRVLRIDAAHGLRDGANAITVGWSAKASPER